jgi:predicted ABC-type transport system involved in lysophospholipase L1 biosynthesis ATPase subunit
MNSPVVVGGTLIEARDVRKSFGQTPALRGASVAVGRGEILAIMGPSGSGKSTLLHCLAGIFAPDSGEVWLNGSRMDTLDEAARTKLRRTAFGFVFQFGQLVPELTAADNVAMPLLLNRVRRRTAYQTADTWLDKLGIGDKGGRRTGELSGGEAQRVASRRRRSSSSPTTREWRRTRTGWSWSGTGWSRSTWARSPRRRSTRRRRPTDAQARAPADPPQRARGAGPAGGDHGRGRGRGRAAARRAG